MTTVIGREFSGKQRRRYGGGCLCDLLTPVLTRVPLLRYLSWNMVMWGTKE
jgi:hypothetical protein